MRNAIPIILSGGTPDLNYGTTSGMLATDSGFAEWHWHDMTFSPVNNSSVLNIFGSGGGIQATQEWGYEQITPAGNRLNIKVDPSNPDVSNNTASTDDGNKRAEVYNVAAGGSFTIENPVGTIEWFGFNISFKSSYVIDPDHPFAFFQSKPQDENGNSNALVILQIAANGESGAADGEIMVVLDASATKYNLTGIIPTAGSSYDIVGMILHEQGTSGAFKLWINGNVVYDEDDITTMYTPSSGAGALKFGAYKWRWSSQANINDSIASGSDILELSISPLRIDRRFIGDATYGDDKYDLVKPQ